MKIAVVTDTHAGRGNDSLIHDQYFSRFFEEVFFPEIKKREIKTIWHLGDVFDRRRFINFDILARHRRYFLEPISQYETFVILGNHDIYYSEQSKLNSVELLCGHVSNFHIMEEAKEFVFDGVKVLFLPWINKENHQRTMNIIEKSDARIAVGHFELEGYEMDRGVISKHGLNDSIFSKFDLVMSGHFHHKSIRGKINYLGTPFEQTWADCDDSKGFYVFDTETMDVEFIQNPLTLYKKFYYDDVNREQAALNIINNSAADFAGKFVKIYIENRTQNNIFDTIHKLIAGAGAHDISIIDKIPEFAIDKTVSAGLTDSVELAESVGNEDTGKIISTYVAAAKYPAHIDPSRVQKQMDSLYTEASQMTAQT